MRHRTDAENAVYGKARSGYRVSVTCLVQLRANALRSEDERNTRMLRHLRCNGDEAVQQLQRSCPQLLQRLTVLHLTMGSIQGPRLSSAAPYEMHGRLVSASWWA